MRVAQISKAGGAFELVDRPMPQPGPGEVRLKVEACGICHSDAFVKHAAFPGITLPRVPGHEVVGLIDAVGDGVTAWKAGQRVGTGWHGGQCFTCDPCRRGVFICCANQQINGITRDGGYAEFMLARAEALAALPKGLTPQDAAPLLCAGITTYNALRNSSARSGDLVAVLGIGGLGHLGIQYAARMGFHTVAVSRGADKADLARKLGAAAYIDSGANDAAQALLAMGGARVILATAPSKAAVESVIGGLGVDGQLVLVGAFEEPLSISGLHLIMGRRSIVGWPSGAAIDSQDTLNFSELAGVRPMIEEFPLTQVNEAYERMHSGAARFRVVLRP